MASSTGSGQPGSRHELRWLGVCTRGGGCAAFRRPRTRALAIAVWVRRCPSTTVSRPTVRAISTTDRRMTTRPCNLSRVV